jgi:hypothetical protein
MGLSRLYLKYQNIMMSEKENTLTIGNSYSMILNGIFSKLSPHSPG